MNVSFRWLSIALLLFTVSCSAQKRPVQALVVEDGPTWNFGKVTHKERLDHNFVLRNNGSDTIRITNVKAACGCTAVMVSGSTVPPGGTASVSVQFTPPRTTNGHVSKSVSVFTEGEQQPAHILRIEADVQSAFVSDPALVNINALTVNKAYVGTFVLKNVSSEKQSIQAAQSALAIEFRGLDGENPPEVRPIEDVVIEPKIFTLESGAEQTMTVRFTPPFEGKLLGSVVLYAEDETRQVEFAGKATRAR